MERMVSYVVLLCALVWSGCGGGQTSVDAGSDTGTDTSTVTTTVSGRVLDSLGTPVANATVVITSDPVETTTDASGVFQATIELGRHTLSVSREGTEFHRSTFVAPDTSPVDLGDLLPTSPYHQKGLILRDHGTFGARFYEEYAWCAVTLIDGAGELVTGRRSDRFTITEAIVRKEDESVAAEEEIPLQLQIDDEWIDAGAFEKSVSAEKLDLVFIMDVTGSMQEHEESVRNEIHGFIDRLAAGRVDFRVAGVAVSGSPGFDHFRFHGPMEIDRLHEAVDYEFTAAGESWTPSTVYDALLFTPRLGPREDARKVAVIITDIVPQTVYGAFGYEKAVSYTTRTAVEMFLAEQEFELFYSKDLEKQVDIDLYYDNGMNPRAGPDGDPAHGIEGSSFGNLRWGGGMQAVELAWPFDQDDLWARLGLSALPPEDSLVYLSWATTFDWHGTVDDLSDHPEDYLWRITVETQDPDAPSQTLSAMFTEPVEKDLYTLTIHAYDEEGSPFPDGELSGCLHQMRGGRRTTYENQFVPVGNTITQQLPPGPYLIELYDAGRHAYDIDALRAFASRPLEMPPGDLELDMTVRTAEHLSDVYRLRGQLADLDDWRVSGDPFEKFVRAATAWLDEIESDGLSWREMIALRRLNVALSAYTKFTEYAQLESQRAIEDFTRIIKDIRDIIAAIEEIHKSTKMSWRQKLAAMVLEGLYDLFTQGRFTELKQMVQWGLEELLDYAGGEVVDEIREYIIDQIPANGEIFGVMVNIVNVLIDTRFTHDGDGYQPDWEPVVRAARDLAIGRALDDARQLVDDTLVDNLFDQLELADDLEETLHDLLDEVLAGVISRDGFDGFDARLDQWAQDVGVLLYAHGRDNVVAAVEAVFDRLDDALEDHGVHADVRDFLVGFARDLALQAIPRLRTDGLLDYRIDPEAVVNVLIKHSLYNLVLRHFYVDEVETAMFMALDRARQVVRFGPAEGADRYEWESDMASDFSDYRIPIYYLKETVWDALSTQDDIENWAAGLQVLTKWLDTIVYGLDGLATFYPPMEETADAVHGFIAVLDGIQVIVRAVEFGLKLDCLDTLGDEARHLYLPAY